MNIKKSAFLKTAAIVGPKDTFDVPGIPEREKQIRSGKQKRHVFLKPKAVHILPQKEESWGQQNMAFVIG